MRLSIEHLGIVMILFCEDQNSGYVHVDVIVYFWDSGEFRMICYDQNE